MDAMGFIRNIKDICETILSVYGVTVLLKKPMTSTTSSITRFKKNLRIKFCSINKVILNVSYGNLKKSLNYINYQIGFKKVYKWFILNHFSRKTCQMVQFEPFKKAVNDPFRVDFKKMYQCHTSWLFKKIVNTSFACLFQVTLEFSIILKKAMTVTLRDHYNIKKALWGNSSLLFMCLVYTIRDISFSSYQ